MTLNSRLAIVMILPLFAWGCKKDEPAEVDLGHGYFPRTVGSWIEYQVDSMWRDDEANVRDSVSYQLKEKVVEAYTDPQGRPAWRIHRFVRDADQEWVVRDVWTSSSDALYAEVTEENVRRLKMSFPATNGRTWDANAYNTEDEMEVAFRDAGASWSSGGLGFAKTVTVKSTVQPNIIDTLIFHERYAEGVGLVQKFWSETETQYHYPPNQPPVPRTKGWHFSMTILAYGTE